MTILFPLKKIRLIRFNYLLITLLFYGFISVNNSYGTEQYIDSLKVINSQLSNDKKSNIYLHIAKHYNYSNYDSAIFYAKKSLEYAKKSNNSELEVKSLLQSAISNNNIGNSELSLELLSKAKQLAENESNFFLVAKCYQEKARLYNSKFDYYKVLLTLDSALVIINKYNINKLKPEVLNYTGNLFLKINNIQTATYYTKQASEALKKDNNIPMKVSNLLLQARIMLVEKKYSSSFNTFNKALALSKQSDSLKLIQLAYRRLGAYYMAIKEYDTSFMYTDSSLTYCKDLGLLIEQSSLITYKSHIMWMQNDFKNALKYNLEALKIRQYTGHKSVISSSLLNIGGNYIELHDYKKAREYITKGLEIAKDQKILSFISRGYEKMSLLNKIEGNFKDALTYNELMTKLNDSILLKRTNNKVIFFSNLYELEKEKRLIESLRLKKKSNEVLFLILGTILSLGVILLLFRINFFRRKTTKEILKLSKIIETTKQSVAISNEEGKLQYVNNGLVKMLGYSSVVDFIGVGIFNFTDERGQKLLENEILPTLLSTGNWEGEINFFKNDRTLIVCELTCSIIKDQQNKIDLFVAIFNDISNRKKNELDIKISREHLKKAVKTQDKIFSIIAHDLTGPFNTILGFSELMSKDYYKFSDKQHIQYNKIINESSKNTFELLNNLLHWSRSQMGRIEINMAKINLYHIVEETAELLKLQIINKEITFSNSVDHFYNITADKATISIIIRNILSNSIKFTQRKGLIYVSTSEEPDYNNITITDNGIGIEKHLLKNLFTSSNNTSSPGTEDEKGTGLGLMLCKELVELNGGKIKVESTLDKGTRFIISLPKAE